MNSHFMRQTAALGAYMMSFAALSACADVEVGHEEAPQPTVEELKNAPVFPSQAPLDGVVLIRIKAPVEPAGEDKLKHCTGQVVSRNTVLTAAHCLWDAGFPGDVGRWDVMIWTQVGINDWELISGGNTWVNAHVNLRPGSRGDYARDVALIRHPSQWSYITEDDAALIMKVEATPDSAWVPGFGLYASSPTAVDYQVRAAQVSVTINNQNEFVYAASGNMPRICRGDSGGPLKHAMGGRGLVYGVSTSGIGGDEYCGDTSFFASAFHNWQWISNTMGTCGSGWMWMWCW